MKQLIIFFTCLLISVIAFSQERKDSLKKIEFIYDFTIGVKTITVQKFNDGSIIKMPTGVAVFSQDIGLGKPFKYLISAHLGMGLNVGSFFDSKKTFLSVVTYGATLQKGFTVKKKFFIEPFTGWQNAISFSTFSRFIGPKSNARINQNNFIVIGCDFSIFMSSLTKKNKADYGLSQVGLKLGYNLPLEAAYIKEGAQFFPNGIGTFSLAGFSAGIFCRLF